MGDSIYDTFYNDEDLELNLNFMHDWSDTGGDFQYVDIGKGKQESAGFLGDSKHYENKFVQDNDPSKFFWEYNRNREDILGSADEAVQNKINVKKRGIVDTAIDTSMSLSDKYGKSNLMTGDDRYIQDSISTEVKLSSDNLSSKGRLSNIRTGRKINKLRSQYKDEIEDQRQEYEISKQKGGQKLMDEAQEDIDTETARIKRANRGYFKKQYDALLNPKSWKLGDVLAFDFMDGG